MSIQIRTVLTAVMVAGLVAACANGQSRVSSPDQYMHKVKAQLSEGDLRTAESTLGEMELYYPISGPTQAMQLELINAYYKAADFDRTVVAAKRFTSMFPNAADIDQAYYLSGMANYDRGLKSLAASANEKSPLYAKVAKENFMALLRCCAESPFASDVSEKVAYLDEALAQYEFGLMRAELLDGNRLAAVAKGNYILEAHPATTAAGVTEVMLSAMDNPEVLDRLLIATALTINQDEAEAIAHTAGMVAAESTAIKSDDIATGVDREMAEGGTVALNSTSAEIAAEMAPVIAGAAAMVRVEEEGEPAAVIVAAKFSESPRYTVQLGSSRKLATVQRYMQRLGLADAVTYERRMVRDEVWHAALYGAYVDKEAAQRAADGITVRTGVKELWVRRLTDTPVEPRAVVADAKEGGKGRAPEVTKQRALGKYAIQIASEQNLDSLKAEMRSMKLDGLVEYQRREVDNKTIYSALYGAYDDMQSARADLPGLQSRTKKDGLWVRALNKEQNVVVE